MFDYEALNRFYGVGDESPADTATAQAPTSACGSRAAIRMLASIHKRLTATLLYFRQLLHVPCGLSSKCQKFGAQREYSPPDFARSAASAARRVHSFEDAGSQSDSQALKLLEGPRCDMSGVTDTIPRLLPIMPVGVPRASDRVLEHKISTSYTYVDRGQTARELCALTCGLLDEDADYCTALHCDVHARPEDEYICWG
nr:hypothetical protein CFP56_53582 [Quercus suber]